MWFSAGNNGAGDDSGTGGNSDSVLSPATAKNVITVGAGGAAGHHEPGGGGRADESIQRCSTPRIMAIRWRVSSSRGNVGISIRGQRGAVQTGRGGAGDVCDFGPFDHVGHGVVLQPDELSIQFIPPTRTCSLIRSRRTADICAGQCHSIDPHGFEQCFVAQSALQRCRFM